MIRLYVNDELLDLEETASITITQESPAYLGEDVGKIKGAFSYPFSLPLTDNNRRLLNFPDRLDNDELPGQEIPATLYVGPDLLMTGYLSIKTPTRTSVQVYLISNPLKDLTKVSISDTDHGDVSANDEPALATLMKYTAENPLDQDFVFAPFYNLALRDDVNIIPASAHFMNAWHFDDQRFLTEYNVTPLPRVAPILTRSIEDAGYSFTDAFFTTDELRRMVLINNRSLRFEDQLSTRIPLNLCLPDLPVSDLLKSLCLTYCLAPFSDSTGKHISLIPLRSIVNNAPRADWTDYASRDYSRDPANGAVDRYTWGDGANADTYFFSAWSDDYTETTETVRDFLDENGQQIDIPDGENYYFFGRSAVSIRKNIRGLLGFVFVRSFGWVQNSRGGETVTPSIPPAQTNRILFFPSNFDELVMASIADSPVGITTGEVTPPQQFGVITSEKGDISARLSFYRGLHETDNGQLYPLLNHSNTNADYEVITDETQSLNWLGDAGLYNQWWKEWDGMLENSAIVTRTFLLPLTEILSFDFRNKVRVENRNYFVRSMEYTITQRGVTPTKCELVSVS